MESIKKLCIFAVLALPRIVGASACYSDCTFIRGDANCDGVVNTADVSAIGTGYFTNADAADVNDDGTVTLADMYALSYYLSSHVNPPPACPFPDAGWDCTADNLETCCSPPINATSQMTFTCGTATVTNSGWDTPTDTESSTGGKCVGDGVTLNDSIDKLCNHPDCSATFKVTGSTATDNNGFTKKRLANGVQHAYLKVKMEAWFEVGAHCDISGCNGINKMWTDLVPNVFRVDVYAAPYGSQNGNLLSYSSFARTFHYSYWLDSTGGCHVDDLGANTRHQTATDTIDITDDLKALPATDCALWVITKVETFDAGMHFSKLTGPDIATTEKIELQTSAWVEYTWCTCQ